MSDEPSLRESPTSSLWQVRDLHEEIDVLRATLKLAEARIIAWQGSDPDLLLDLIAMTLAGKFAAPPADSEAG